MVKVITYGTFDLLHQGHINILKRAKALGDYLIVGVTTENFDITRGKVNVRQSLIERMEAVRQTGIADEVIPEEYLGQKIDDIKRNGVSIFAIGSDWKGQFDYLNEYCEVVYLPRTAGISSSQLRSEEKIKIGMAGDDPAILKILNQSAYVNGVSMEGLFDDECVSTVSKHFKNRYADYSELLKNSDAVYIAVRPEQRYAYIKQALNAGKHVLSESPLALMEGEVKELYKIADSKKLVLFDSVKVAYSLPY